jgi:hypothetical protein
MEVEGYAPEVQYVFNSTNSVGNVYAQIARVLPEHVWRPILNEIRDTYEQEFKHQTRMSFSVYWLIRAKNEFNPLLNKALNRPEDWPTLNNLMAYAMRDQIWFNQHARKLTTQQPRDERWKIYPSDRKIQ